MAMSLNVVAVSGNLTRDPELVETSGDPICKMRIAINGREKKANGDWGDRAHYIDVSVWGKQGENANRYLSKGDSVMIHGSLRYEEWEANDGSGKRNRISITARECIFGSKKDRDSDSGSRDSGGGGGDRLPPVPAADDDDIPF